MKGSLKSRSAYIYSYKPNREMTRVSGSSVSYEMAMNVRLVYMSDIALKIDITLINNNNNNK